MPALKPEQIATLTLITTIALALITGYYALITHKILKYQKEMAELEKRPFLMMHGIIVNFYKVNQNDNKGGIQLGVRLVNVSRVLLKYNMIKRITSIEHLSNPNTEPLNNGGYVYPNQTVEFTYEAINDIDLTNDVITGDLEYEMEYYSVENKKYKSIRQYKVFIYTRSQSVQWKSIKEEEIEIK